MMNSRPTTPDVEAAATESDALALQQAHEEKLIAIVKDVGPRVYQLKLGDDEEITFVTFGCQGSGDSHQHETSRFLHDILAKSEKRPHFILILGDNIYDYGVTSTKDEGFNKCFYDVYDTPELKNVAKFLILGNHDGNYHSKALLSTNPTGEQTEQFEVMHTYDAAPDASHALYKQTELDIAQLPPWNMPYFYYSIIAGDLQIFCLDSNRYIKDLLLAETSGTENPNNQATWLKREYDKAIATGRRTAVAMHHPLYTSGKRAFPEKYDSGHYLTPQQIREINRIMRTDTSSYNQLIAHGFRYQKIQFDMAFVAHDHFISYYRDHTLCQLTLGGGGGDLQSRESFVGHPHVASHLRQNGFCIVSYSRHRPLHFDYHLYTTKGHHLHYRNDSHLAIHEPSTDESVEQLRSGVLKACDNFLTRLRYDELLHMEPGAGKQPEESSSLYRLYDLSKWAISQAAKVVKSYFISDSTRKEVIAVHDLIAFFNQPSLPSLADCANRMDRYLQPLFIQPVTESSFVRQLDQTLFNDFEIDLNKLLMPCEEKERGVML